MLQDGQPIAGTCGVFVKAGGTGVGTPENPFGSISDAIAVAAPAGVAVFVCTGTYDEFVDLPQGTSLVGAVDCANDWKYRATPALMDRSVLAPTAGLALSVHTSGSQAVAVVSGFVFHAADAAFASESSVAVIVNAAPVRFEQCRFEAGAGQDGTDAVMSGQAPTAGGAGNNGLATQMVGCGSPGAPLAGAQAKTNPSCAATGGKGGSGGDGTGGNAGSGDDGSPKPPGGTFGLASACTGMSCIPCSPGSPGGPGTNGGKGAPGIGLGSFLSNWEGVNGGKGDDGTPGGGGGGGGGARSTNGCSGDSGGSGGAGGCGGAGGPGGTYGGSSIAIAVRGTANVTFFGCSASSAPGGRGGNGAPGVVGAEGGVGGLGGDHNASVLLWETNGCTGGLGGKGGDGGHGGGGSGGHSVGLLCAETTCDATGITFDPVMPSFAGAGGLGDGTNDGSAGQAIETLTL